MRSLSCSCYCSLTRALLPALQLARRPFSKTHKQCCPLLHCTTDSFALITSLCIQWSNLCRMKRYRSAAIFLMQSVSTSTFAHSTSKSTMSLGKICLSTCWIHSRSLKAWSQISFVSLFMEPNSRVRWRVATLCITS